MSSKRRTEIVPVRLTADELAKLDSLVGNKFSSRSAAIRYRLRSGNPEQEKETVAVDEAWLSESAKLRFELAQVGKNLNQLVKLAHSRKLHTSRDFDEVLDLLFVLLREVQAGLESWTERVDRLIREADSRW